VVALARVVNIAERAEVEKFFAAVWCKIDQVDVLINNVGVAGPRAALEDVDPQDWTHVFDANLNAAFWTMRQVLPRMKQRRQGVILNVTTASVATLPQWRTPYTVSKAALESLTVSTAREAGPFNIRCNAVRPGLMDEASSSG
jgi:NAD(P)-dependent dehydrogenase (short-subunit alcohol dehydrogenase family)